MKMKEIIINKDKEKLTIVLTENGLIIEKYTEIENQKRNEGNIYLGKVQNVLQGMQAAFIDIGEGKNTFIRLKDALPKVDEKKNNVQEIMDNVNIKDIVKTSTPILVQVKRDATNQKGARVSTHISIPSRYLILMPDAEFITISQKIENEQERERLLNLVKEILPEGYGAIIRTSAENKKDDEIKKDVLKSINGKKLKMNQK